MNVFSLTHEEYTHINCQDTRSWGHYWALFWLFDSSAPMGLNAPLELGNPSRTIFLWSFYKHNLNQFLDSTMNSRTLMTLQNATGWYLENQGREWNTEWKEVRRSISVDKESIVAVGCGRVLQDHILAVTQRMRCFDLLSLERTLTTHLTFVWWNKSGCNWLHWRKLE